MINSILHSFRNIISLVLGVILVILITLCQAQNEGVLGNYYFDEAGLGLNQGILLKYSPESNAIEYEILNLSTIPFVPRFSLTISNERGEAFAYYTGRFIVKIENQELAIKNKLEFDHGIEMDLNWNLIHAFGPHAYPKSYVLLPTLSASEYLLIHSGIKVWQNDPKLLINGQLYEKPNRFLLPDMYDDFMKHDTYSDGIMATRLIINSDNTISVPRDLNEFRIGYGMYRSEIAACKHANGKDWWILAPKITHNLMSVFLYDLNEIKYVGEFPLSRGNTYSNPVLGSFVFSPDGSKLLRTHRRIRYPLPDSSDLGPDDILEIWEFDRCIGQVIDDPIVLSFSRPAYFDPEKRIPFGYHEMYQKPLLHDPSFLVDEPFVNFAGCFSEDASKVFVANGIHIIQVDLDKQYTLDTLFTYDSHSKAVKRRFTDEYGYLPTLPDAFWNLPNGKIVVGSNNINSAVHMIHNPNLQGKQSNFEFEALQFKSLEDPTRLELYTIRGLPSYPHYFMTALHIEDCKKEEIVEPEDPKISIGPNPFSNEITVNVPFSGFYSIEVFDLLGRNLWKQNLASPGNLVGSVRIDTHHLPAGVYVVVVDDLVKNSIKSFKVLKLK